MESNDKIKIAQLSWWIREQKLLYYNPKYGKCVDDAIYDKKELEYIKYCKKLGIEPTASNNVGFPWDTASGRLVASKYCENDNRPKLDYDGAKNRKIVIDFEKELDMFLELANRPRKRKRPIN